MRLTSLLSVCGILACAQFSAAQPDYLWQARPVTAAPFTLLR